MAIFANEKNFCKGNTPSPMRRMLFYVTFVGAYVGVVICCTVHSRNLGYYYSLCWLWTFLLGFLFDLLVYEPLLWMIYMMTEDTFIGEAIRRLKSIKTA